jgi:hypothetical protein
VVIHALNDASMNRAAMRRAIASVNLGLIENRDSISLTISGRRAT